MIRKDLMVLGGPRLSDPPSLLLFGVIVHSDHVYAGAYLVKTKIRKGRVLRELEKGSDVRALILDRMEPGYIMWESIKLPIA